jgi:hypothetical protein
MKVLRRSFLGAVLSSIPLLQAQAGLIWIGDNYVRDPFVKVYTKLNKTVKYQNHEFFQTENFIGHSLSTDSYVGKWTTSIPISAKINQKTKGDMIKEMNKYKNIDYECFELIADNGKSNLYAVCDNDKFRANLKGNGKSQCQIQLN